MNASYRTFPKGKGLPFFALSVVLILPLIFFPVLLSAGTCTWNSSFGNWSDPANWSPVGLPLPTDEVVINGGTVTMDINVVVNSLRLTGDANLDGAGSVEVNQFDWESGNIGGSGDFRVNGNMAIFTSGAKTLSGKDLYLLGTGSWSEGDIFLSNGRTFQIGESAHFTVSHTTTQTIGSGASGVISVLGIFEKTSTATTNFTGILNVSGSLQLQSGTLQAQTIGAGNFTGPTTLATGAKLQLPLGTYTFSNSIAGAGSLVVSGATVNFETGASLGASLDFTTGNLNNNTNLTIANLNVASSGTIGGTGITTISDLFTWSSGTISAGATVVSQGNASLGSTSIKSLNGTLEINNVGDWSNGNINIGSNGVLRINAAGTLNISHAGIRIIGGTTNGLVEINGGVTKTGAGTTRLRCKCNVNAGGSLSLLAGTLQCDANSSGENNGAIAVSAGAVLDINNGTHNFNAGAMVSGGGTTRVSNVGIANFNEGASLGSRFEITGGTATDNQGIQPTQYLQSGGVFTGNGSPTVTGSMTWSAGTISGAGVFSVNGTSAFSGSSNRTLSAKQLLLQGSGSWSGGNFTFASDAQLTVGAAATLSMTHTSGQAMSGTGSLLVNGTLSKNHDTAITTFTGVILNNNGNIIGQGSLSYGTLNNNGSYLPGVEGIGRLSVSNFGNAVSTLEIELQGIGGAGIDHDQVQVSGSTQLGGTLTVSLLKGFVPSPGESFIILTAGAMSGTFSTINLPSLPADRNWSVEYNSNNVTLKLLDLNLPVELTEFGASLEADKAKLTWKTASESNNLGFNVLRSLDGEVWQRIGFVAGNGTTHLPNNYHFSDLLWVAGRYYYRLEQMDLTGKTSLSPIVSLLFEGASDGTIARLLQNPIMGNEIKLELIGEAGTRLRYRLYDQSGKTMKANEVTTDQLGLVVNIALDRALANGIYYLSLETHTQQQVLVVVK